MIGVWFYWDLVPLFMPLMFIILVTISLYPALYCLQSAKHKKRVFELYNSSCIIDFRNYILNTLSIYLNLFDLFARLVCLCTTCCYCSTIYRTLYLLVAVTKLTHRKYKFFYITIFQKQYFKTFFGTSNFFEKYLLPINVEFEAKNKQTIIYSAKYIYFNYL